MKTYKYEIASFIVADDPEMQAKINEYGVNGWKVVKLEGQPVQTGTLKPNGAPVMALSCSILFEKEEEESDYVLVPTTEPNVPTEE